jgi:hypothetical protein
MSVLRYDSKARRLWIAGQRCHHGATGAIMSGAAAAALVAGRRQLRTLLIALTGGLLMVHDWHDRALWFKPGAQLDV